jgi:hypothetical protein
LPWAYPCALLRINIWYSAVRDVTHVYLVERSLSDYSCAIQTQKTPLRSVRGLTGGMGQPILDSPLIYVVDDDVSIARLVFLTLESQGYQVSSSTPIGPC